jgi:hypothetical protein
VSHGAIQFMTYEEMKNTYNQYRMVPIDTKLVGVIYIINNKLKVLHHLGLS